MGTKTILLFASWIVSALSNHYIPSAWSMIFLPELTVKSLVMGTCAAYSVWLLWMDYEKIWIGIVTLWEFETDRIKSKLNRSK